jgi:hypothetical protein
MPFSPRRLAALDMAGAGSGRRRRWVILIEFVAGAVLCGMVGGYLVLAAHGASRLLGWWLVAVAVNYLPLVWYAFAMARPGVLNQELAGVDRRAELARYSWRQLWIAVPGAVVVAAVAEETRPHRRVRRRIP